MPCVGAVTLADYQRQGCIMLEVGCTKCPRHSRHRLDELIAMHGPNCGLPSLAKFVSWDCPKRQMALVDDPYGARCLPLPSRR